MVRVRISIAINVTMYHPNILVSLLVLFDVISITIVKKEKMNAVNTTAYRNTFFNIINDDQLYGSQSGL